MYVCMYIYICSMYICIYIYIFSEYVYIYTHMYIHIYHIFVHHIDHPFFLVVNMAPPVIKMPLVPDLVGVLRYNVVCVGKGLGDVPHSTQHPDVAAHEP